MTLKEFADYAEISVSLAYAIISEGRVAHRRIGRKGKGGKITVKKEDADQFLESVRQEVRSELEWD